MPDGERLQMLDGDAERCGDHTSLDPMGRTISRSRTVEQYGYHASAARSEARVANGNIIRSAPWGMRLM